VLSNDNKLLRNYPGALGGKTGFTDDARHTQVDAAQRGGRRLIVILMRGEQRPVPMWEQAARLLNYGFALTPGRPVGRLVDEAAPLETAGSAPGPTGTTSGLPGLPAADAQDRTGRPPSASGLLPVALWIGAAVIVLAVLGTLVARQRR
jgi:D-alanyl-D-alanine carboxypeptidase (penicillin-binding protein 5/6)